MTKHLALNQCHWAVATPRTFWAAQRAKRWGRYRPSCVFCPRSFFTGWSLYRLRSWALTRAGDRTRAVQIGQNTACVSVFCLSCDSSGKKALPVDEASVEAHGCSYLTRAAGNGRGRCYGLRDRRQCLEEL